MIAASPQNLSVQEVMLSRCDDIIHWITQEVPYAEIGRRLGLSLSDPALYYNLKKLGLTYKALNLADCSGPSQLSFQDILQRVGQPSPQQNGQRIQDYLLQNSDLILALYKYDFTQIQMAHIFGFDTKLFSVTIGNLNLTRKALGLPRRRILRKSYVNIEDCETPSAGFSDFEDMHIRRGHYCGFSLAAVGAICRRSSIEIAQRAASIGLGVWPPLSAPQDRLNRAQDFDTQNDISILTNYDASRTTGRKAPISIRRSKTPDLSEHAT